MKIKRFNDCKYSEKCRFRELIAAGSKSSLNRQCPVLYFHAPLKFLLVPIFVTIFSHVFVYLIHTFGFSCLANIAGENDQTQSSDQMLHFGAALLHSKKEKKS